MDNLPQVFHGFSGVCAGGRSLASQREGAEPLPGPDSRGRGLVWVPGLGATFFGAVTVKAALAWPCEYAGLTRMNRVCNFFPPEFSLGSVSIVSRYGMPMTFIVLSSQVIVEHTLTPQPAGGVPGLLVSPRLGPVLATGADPAQAPWGPEVTFWGQRST